MTPEEALKNAAILTAYAEGKQIQTRRFEKGDENKWIDTKNPIWNFQLYDYRIKPKAIMVTPEELKGMNRKWYKSKRTGRIYCEMQLNECMENAADPNLYFRLDPETKCWEEWSEELERELMK